MSSENTQVVTAASKEWCFFPKLNDPITNIRIAWKQTIIRRPKNVQNKSGGTTNLSVIRKRGYKTMAR
jgi:hypothetical protein